MSNETNALLALKNAWNGAIAASDRLRELAPVLSALAEDTDVSTIDLETYRQATLAHAIAAEAVRGLVEELQRHAAKVAQGAS